MPAKKILFIFVFFTGLLSGQDNKTLLDEDLNSSLFEDLAEIEKIDRKNKENLPLLFNYFSQGGYFTMPSARSAEKGNLSMIFSYLPPYRVYGVSFQLFSHLELSANYFVFHGISDPTFGHLGFGDSADRTANLKLNILKKSDGISCMPEIAIGLNDFMGTKRFKSLYLVATEEFLNYNFEISLGLGKDRMHGLFGAIAWTPFRQFESILKNLSFALEYDCNNYRHHKWEHPKGREIKYPVNMGIYYRFLDLFQLSVSSLRGKDIAAAATFTYNLGETKGIFPKIKDPPIYSIIDTEALGPTRTEKEFCCDLANAFNKQGLKLYCVRSFYDSLKRKILWIKIINPQYRSESHFRERVENILGSLSPSDVYAVALAVESQGVLLKEYFYRTEDLRRYCSNQVGAYELSVVSPMKDVNNIPGEYDSILLFKQKKKLSIWTLMPEALTFFGNSTGKFKYDIGFIGGPEGYFFDQFYYKLQANYTISSSTSHLATRDTLNPSKIINVRSDTIKYYRANSLHIEKAFLQKCWNLTHGFFGRLSGGYFEIAYGGLGLEMLYYPTHSSFGIGLDLALLWKRNYFGLGFTNEVYKFDGQKSYKVPFIGEQYFLDVYYSFKPLNLDFKFSLGQFLAKDKGIRLEAGRTFKSGLTVSIWYTFTNAGDVINGDRYYDKGVSFSLPLDVFMNKSSKTRIGYAMSAWLRDIGARVYTGNSLYPILYYERQE